LLVIDHLYRRLFTGFRWSTGGQLFVEGYDVTDRVVGQIELAEREAEFRALADNMSQLAWMTDERGLAYWFNKRWLDYPPKLGPSTTRSPPSLMGARAPGRGNSRRSRTDKACVNNEGRTHRRVLRARAASNRFQGSSLTIRTP
jgi:PAS domain-containing protein